MYIIQLIILISISISMFCGVKDLLNKINCKDRALIKISHLTLISTLDKSTHLMRAYLSTDLKCKTLITSKKEIKYAKWPNSTLKVQFNLKGKVSNN